MPIVSGQTVPSFDLRESDARGAVFVTSRSRRRTLTFMISFQVLVLAMFGWLWIQHRMKWIGDVLCGTGAVISIAFLAALLRHRGTSWELRTDRERMRVSFRERKLRGAWVDHWSLEGSEVESVVLTHPKTWAVSIALLDGRRLNIDESLQEEPIRILASHLSAALGKPLREPWL